MHPISAVIFDMDGLMFDSERVARDLWFDIARRRGYSISNDVYLSILGTNIKATMSILQHALGPDAPVAAMQEEKQLALEDAVRLKTVPLKSGLIELLDALETLGLRKAVGTSSPHALARLKLGTYGLLPRFEHIVGGDQVSHAKPAPDIFLAVAEKIGVEPAQCVVLEDSENGVRAAHAAGMRPIMIPDLVQPRPEIRALAWHVLDSLHDAPHVLHAY